MFKGVVGDAGKASAGSAKPRMDAEVNALTGMLDYEVEASKRYRRFVSLVMMHVKSTDVGPLTDKWLGTMSEEMFRSTDRVFPLDQGGTMAVLMGETESQGALRAVERFQELYGSALAVHSSIASYPVDGLSSQDLFSVAQRRLDVAEQSQPGAAIWRDESGPLPGGGGREALPN
jgi:hypothetical protein